MKNVTIAIVFFYGILHVATSKFCRKLENVMAKMKTKE